MLYPVSVIDGLVHQLGGPKLTFECKMINLLKGGCKVGNAVETTPGRASRLSNKADITAGYPNVKDLLRYQKIADLSFQQNHESTISSNLTKTFSSSTSPTKASPADWFLCWAKYRNCPKYLFATYGHKL